MDTFVGFIAVIGVTFPVSFLVARSCLRGVIRLMTGGERRDVL